MEQSFSAQNLRKIWEYRTRRGEALSRFFADILALNAEVGRARRDYLDELKSANLSEFELELPWSTRPKAVQDALGKWNEVREAKELALGAYFQGLSDRINSAIEADQLTFQAEPLGTANHKTVYGLRGRDRDVVYFASRQVELNLRRAFSVKSADRQLVSKQLLAALDDESDKFIIRTDIRSFFESVPHEALREMLKVNDTLSRRSSALLEPLLDHHAAFTGEKKGLPRGLGLSSVLAEAFLQQLDRTVESEVGASVYLRYVDDIVIVQHLGQMSVAEFDSHKNNTRLALRKLVAALGLQLNTQKTQYLRFASNRSESTGRTSFTFLGYAYRQRFDSKGVPSGVAVDISNKRVDKYVSRINASFDAYLCSNKTSRDEYALIERIKFLCGNTSLSNNKRGARVGIFFTNSIVDSNVSGLRKLDRVLSSRIRTLPPGKLSVALSKYSFQMGHQMKSYYKISSKRMSAITRVWRNGE